jgi:two-component system chemotaxis response regulator CheY
VSKRILLVDDARIICEVIKAQSLGGSIELLEAADGDQALRLLQHERVDLIISDVSMPDRDGISFVKRIRQHARAELRRVPIILLTSVKQTEQLCQDGMAAGASELLPKPVASANLLTVVSRYLESLPAP